MMLAFGIGVYEIVHNYVYAVATEDSFFRVAIVRNYQ
jgi:hypothetical protein